MPSSMPSNTTENAVALGLVVIANWLLAHLATNWAMPSEVQSSLQTLIIALLGYWLKKRATRGQSSATVTVGTQPPGAPLGAVMMGQPSSEAPK